jgi:hypothetical protein
MKGMGSCMIASLRVEQRGYCVLSMGVLHL